MWLWQLTIVKSKECVGETDETGEILQKHMQYQNVTRFYEGSENAAWSGIWILICGIKVLDAALKGIKGDLKDKSSLFCIIFDKKLN